MTHEQQAKMCAVNILMSLGNNHSLPVLVEALALAYTTGRRDEANRRVAELVRKDDELNEVT